MKTHRTVEFDLVENAGYPFGVVWISKIALPAALFTLSGSAAAQTIAFVAPGEEPSRPASRAVLRSHEILEEIEEVDVVGSSELRRALAGLPARSGGNEGAGAPEDPLVDVRRLVRRASGERLRVSLNRLGERLGVDLFITVRRVGGELELRGFNVERSAFYSGTLMLPAMAPPDEERVIDFVAPRLAALGQILSEERGSDGDRRRGRSRWWVWVALGGAVAAAILVGYLAQPDEVDDNGVTLRITAP